MWLVFTPTVQCLGTLPRALPGRSSRTSRGGRVYSWNHIDTLFEMEPSCREPEILLHQAISMFPVDSVAEAIYREHGKHELAKEKQFREQRSYCMRDNDCAGQARGRCRCGDNPWEIMSHKPKASHVTLPRE